MTRAIAAVTQLDLVQGNKHSIPTSMHPYYCTASGDWIHRHLMQHRRLKDQLGIDGCSRKKRRNQKSPFHCWARLAQSILPGPQPTTTKCRCKAHATLRYRSVLRTARRSTDQALLPAHCPLGPHLHQQGAGSAHRHVCALVGGPGASAAQAGMAQCVSHSFCPMNGFGFCLDLWSKVDLPYSCGPRSCGRPVGNPERKESSQHTNRTHTYLPT